MMKKDRVRSAARAARAKRRIRTRSRHCHPPPRPGSSRRRSGTPSRCSRRCKLRGKHGNNKLAYRKAGSRAGLQGSRRHGPRRQAAGHSHQLSNTLRPERLLQILLGRSLRPRPRQAAGHSRKLFNSRRPQRLRARDLWVALKEPLSRRRRPLAPATRLAPVIRAFHSLNLAYMKIAQPSLSGLCEPSEPPLMLRI